MTIDTQKLRDWTRYSAERPTDAGIYEWRIPSKAVPGAVLIVAAKMRKRGAGYETVLSPEFDYWDGYQVHVLCDVEWRNTGLVLSENQRTPFVLSVEGLDISPCSHCGKVPRIEAHQCGAYGITICPNPWNLNSWRFVCCAWGNTPTMTDPRDIERIRRATRNSIEGQTAEIETLRIHIDGYDGTIAKRDLEIERLRDALTVTREFVATARAELVVTHGINGVIPADDALGLAGVAECDDIHGQIDAALSGEGK